MIITYVKIWVNQSWFPKVHNELDDQKKSTRCLHADEEFLNNLFSMSEYRLYDLNWHKNVLGMSTWFPATVFFRPCLPFIWKIWATCCGRCQNQICYRAQIRHTKNWFCFPNMLTDHIYWKFLMTDGKY